MTDEVVLDTRVLDKIIRETPEKVSRIVQSHGWRIANRAATVHPWKTDTGALMNSILSESHMKDRFIFILQDGVEYGIFLELGTSRMAAYPFVIPAIMWGERPFIDAFKALFR